MSRSSLSSLALTGTTQSSSDLQACKSTSTVTQSLDQFKLPPELWLYLAQSFLSTRDALSLCSTSSAFRSVLISSLFASTEAKTLEQCIQRLDSAFLIRQPCVASKISKLVLRPSHSESSTSSFHWQAIQGEEYLIKRLELLAPELVSLRTFIWDGHEMPLDSIWATLRACCPGLRYVSSSVGVRPISTESELFKFESLVGFSLTMKQNNRPPWLEHPSWDILNSDSEQLPKSLWDMLYRSKDLEELELGGCGHSSYTRLLNVLPLTQGYWPKMRSLKLGHVLLREEPPKADMTSMNLFERFVSAHRNLKELSLPYATVSLPYPTVGTVTRIMPLRTLAHGVTIESYSGLYPYLHDMFASCNLTTLSLCAQPHAAWCFTLFRQTLELCTSLTSLSLWIDLSKRDLILPPDTPSAMVPELRETDHIKIFRSVLACCPGLLHLKLLCSTKREYTFQMVDFPEALEGGPKLKTLEVQKVICHLVEQDPEMLPGWMVLRMAHWCPSLEKITLRYGLDVWSDEMPFKMVLMRAYDLIADDAGNLVQLECRQRIGPPGELTELRYSMDDAELEEYRNAWFSHWHT